MPVLRLILEVLVNAFGPIIKEVIYESIRDTVVDSRSPDDLRQHLLDQLRDYDYTSP